MQLYTCFHHFIYAFVFINYCLPKVLSVIYIRKMEARYSLPKFTTLEYVKPEDIYKGQCHLGLTPSFFIWIISLSHNATTFGQS